MKYLPVLALLLLLSVTSALSIREETHQLSTMNPSHLAGIPKYLSGSYSSGVVTVKFSIEYAIVGMGKINDTYSATCSYSRICGAVKTIPCCPCSVPQSVSFNGPLVPPSLTSAISCSENYVTQCLRCQRACGLLDKTKSSSGSSTDTTVCQSSTCRSNPQYNRTDCGTV